ncbi:uncharacterized protein [Amphiura filiformis]|uniref:uncharacterized protein n=1 Tax=Amphiura filiformis TaxID=82378 RepID=UPI003B20D748
MTRHVELQFLLLLCVSMHGAYSDNTTTTEEPNEPINSPQKQGQTSLAPYVNFTFSEITTSSAVISWEIDAEIAKNITRMSVNVTQLDTTIAPNRNISKTDVLRIDNLYYLTKYKVCLVAFNENDRLLFDEPACEKFLTRYEPLNMKAIGAIVCVVVIAFLFFFFMGLDLVLDPGQASSMALKKRMLDVKEKERAERKLIGRSTAGESLYEKQKDPS